MMIIAHRGASHDAPENTLAAVKLAWRQGADAVEIDVQVTKDGRIVAIHDLDTKRTGGVDRAVKDQTLEELKTLDVGSWKGEAFRGERIPTLEEVLSEVPQGKRLFAEIKCGREILSPLDAMELDAGKVVFTAFDLNTVRAVKERHAAHQVYRLSRYDEEGLLEEACGLDGLNIKACEAMDQAFIEKVRAVGLKLFIWTVNHAAEFKKWSDLGVDGIFTDLPLIRSRY